MAEVVNKLDDVEEMDAKKRRLAGASGPCRRVSMDMMLSCQRYNVRRPIQCRALKFLAMSIMLVLVPIALLSRDRVPIGHLDLARSYYDRRDVLISRWAELPFGFSGRMPPTYSKEKKEKLGKWKNFDESVNVCTPVSDTPLVWTLKTPKAASSTLQDLIVGLQAQHPDRFVVNTRQLRVDPTKIPQLRNLMLQRYAEYFSSTLSRRTVYTAHGWFIDLELEAAKAAEGPNNDGYAPPPSSSSWYAGFVEWVTLTPSPPVMVRFRPVCVGTLRDPLKRLVSHYEYLQLGPRSMWSVARHGRPNPAAAAARLSNSPTASAPGATGVGAAALGVSSGSSNSHTTSPPGIEGDNSPPDFPQCVALHMAALNRGHTGLAADPYKCVHWAGVQLKYFCGYRDFGQCEEAGNEALEIAQRNVDKHFLLVAVVEHFEESIRLLEILVPTVFEGMSALYAEQGSSRVNTRHIAPSSSSLSASSGSGGKGGGRRRHLLRMAPGHAKPHPGVWSNNHSSSSSPLVDSTQAIKASPSSSSSSSEASLSSAWPLEVADFVREKLHFEQMFYNRMVKRFQLQMAACGVE